MNLILHLIENERQFADGLNGLKNKNKFSFLPVVIYVTLEILKINWVRLLKGK